MSLIFDIETDGLLDDLTTIHSLVYLDTDTGKMTSLHGPEGVENGVRALQEADRIVGHNIIDYDIPAIQRVYPWFEPKGKVVDTLVCSRLLWPDIKNEDIKRSKKGKLPGSLIGSHKLEAWGYRLGRWKGDYAEEMGKRGLDPWAAWNQEMQDYCEQDVRVTKTLYDKIAKEPLAEQVTALRLEHDVAKICAEMERNGFMLDVARCEKLYASLSAYREKLTAELTSLFDPWYRVVDKHFVPERTVTYKDKMRQSTVKGAPFAKIEWVHFNPGSRDHVADRLQTIYGWEPHEFTPTGKPKVDDEVLSGLKYDAAKALAKLYEVNKIIGMIAEGNSAWLKLEEAGFIHGRINPNGAVTGRATHSSPNIAQTPSSKNTYGTACRECFTVPDGWYLVGTDAKGLELRCLAHYMAIYDGGAYANEVINGDIHAVNQAAAEIKEREDAKTFIYAFLYGAGDALLGAIVGGGRAEGAALRARFQNKLPAIKAVIDAIRDVSRQRKFLVGLDGRRLHVRSAYSALNTLLQAAGAVICKMWMVRLYGLLKERGYRCGWDGDFVFCAWVHDELQIAARNKEIASVIEQLSEEAIEWVAKAVKFRLPLAADSKIGKTWAETH